MQIDQNYSSFHLMSNQIINISNIPCQSHALSKGAASAPSPITHHDIPNLLIGQAFKPGNTPTRERLQHTFRHAQDLFLLELACNKLQTDWHTIDEVGIVFRVDGLADITSRHVVLTNNVDILVHLEPRGEGNSRHVQNITNGRVCN
ncbi:hypothetical protein HC256_001425 [Beauveria bassiana]|nr:hypothetical protein HC256_001425 [Beauveria bassiana]